MGEQHSSHACAAWAAHAMAIASFILHLAGTHLINNKYQGRLSLLNRWYPAARSTPRPARDAPKQGPGTTTVSGPVASWNCGVFNRLPYHRGLIKGMKIHPLDSIGEICKVQGQVQYQTSL